MSLPDCRLGCTVLAVIVIPESVNINALGIAKELWDQTHSKPRVSEATATDKPDEGGATTTTKR